MTQPEKSYNRSLDPVTTIACVRDLLDGLRGQLTNATPWSKERLHDADESLMVLAHELIVNPITNGIER